MALNQNGHNPPPEVKLAVAQALGAGLSAADAYRAIRPGVTPASARVAGSQVAALPEVVAMRDAILARSGSVGVLNREQIQQMLSLAAVTPKDAESLSKPENAWMLTKDETSETEHGVARKLAGISTLDALRELSKVSGNYAPQVVQVQHSGAIKSLADAADYDEMLEQERLLARAARVRIVEVETVEDASGDGVGSWSAATAMVEVDRDALATDWLEED